MSLDTEREMRVTLHMGTWSGILRSRQVLRSTYGDMSCAADSELGVTLYIE